MTKTEQMRLMAWRLKVLEQAGQGRRRVARTCRHFGISRKTFYKGKKRLRLMVRLEYATARGRRIAHRERPHVR